MDAIIFIGIQASGKTGYFMQEFSNSHVRISLDMLRTRNRERILLDACISAGQSFVIDNTNPARSDREKYLRVLAQAGIHPRGFYFSSKLNECIVRNSSRAGFLRVPEKGIRSTFRKLELPSLSEGFSELNYVTLKNNGYEVQEWKNEIQ